MLADKVGYGSFLYKVMTKTSKTNKHCHHYLVKIMQTN